MKILLLNLLFLLLLARAGSREECFAHGNFYTLINGKVVDSIDVALRFRMLEQELPDIDARVKEKERLLHIIKTRHCNF